MRTFLQLLFALFAGYLASPAAGGSGASGSIVESWSGPSSPHGYVDADRSAHGEFPRAEWEPEEEDEDDEFASEFAGAPSGRPDSTGAAHHVAPCRSSVDAPRRRARAPPLS